MSTPTDPDVLDPSYSVVIPTIGRESLAALLHALSWQPNPLPRQVVVVDDRPNPTPPLQPPPALAGRVSVTVVQSWGRGPAAARNLGWRLTDAEWVVFVDDDVVVMDDWTTALARDLSATGDTVAGSQARIRVPLPSDRSPTDAERCTAALERAAWITAEMAYRRTALVQAAGFDERFPRAYREDADLALRVRERGWDLVRGEREVQHPVRPAGFWASLTAQRGNADDALLRRLHGPHWRSRAQTGPGMLDQHAATTAAALAAVAGRALPGVPSWVPRAATAAWAGLTAAFAVRRMLPGPGGRAELARMAATSVAIPVAAVAHRVRGEVRHRHAQPWPPRLGAVLFDRDGTLIHDVPCNTDPARVAPLPEAREVLNLLRRNHIRVGVITNQAAVGRGDITHDQLQVVNDEVEVLLGPFDTWQVCPHTPDDACPCRKPQPGMVRRAARELGVPVAALAVVGDIGSDVTAALRAGARSVLVPTAQTRADEVARAPFVASDLRGAAELLLAGVVQ